MAQRGVLRTMGDLVGFWCSGCKEVHVLNVEPDCRPCWGFNRDYDRPTFTPSILVRGKRRITDEEHQRIMMGERLDIPDRVCHSFVTDGRIKFLGDCTHDLRDQTVALEPFGAEAL